MKDNLRRLQWCLKLFGYDDFYTVSITDSDVRLQGKYSNKITTKAKGLRFSSKIDGNGHLEMQRNNITIILT